MHLNEADFRKVYVELSEEGKCDPPGGAEYYRVWEEYLKCDPMGFGTPDARAFITQHANARRPSAEEVIHPSLFPNTPAKE
jgi:hypothetical protein